MTGEAWQDDLDTRFGHSVSSAGDIDKDGYDDLIIGAWRNDGSTGAAYVIYGGKKSMMSNIFLSEKSLKPATTGFKIQGKEAYDKLGFSVGSAGDFNTFENGRGRGRKHAMPPFDNNITLLTNDRDEIFRRNYRFWLFNILANVWQKRFLSNFGMMVDFF